MLRLAKIILKNALSYSLNALPFLDTVKPLIYIYIYIYTYIYIYIYIYLYISYIYKYIIIYNIIYNIYYIYLHAYIYIVRDLLESQRLDLVLLTFALV